MQNLPNPAEERPYDRVKACLEDFKRWREGRKTVAPGDFGQVFRCKISEADWHKLQKDLHIFDNEDHGPFSSCKFSYHTSSSVLVIRYLLTEVHQRPINFLAQVIRSAIPSLDVDVVQGGPTVTLLHGEADRESKQADLSIYEEIDGDDKLKWVLEVGFTETYDDLLKDVRSWLTGREHEVAFGVLMQITEEPAHHCPLADISDEEFEARGLKSRQDISRSDFVMEGEYGPVSYQGDRWAGQIKEIFWEVWRLNSQTQEIELVGEREVIVPETAASPKIQIGQFLSVAPVGAQISPDWDVFRTVELAES
ncbi:uncharacterized protein PV07_08626 [Cladophialophora immunda]|uniref:Uncharacterized protein n=1 Tax=Cladophialophora immunda TaxID=569365 RepID=A0A0D2CPH1_9EURO|nr:uncharacterized protein PV07_08626 [Cladophialophora immunda]KIW25454.1 hypothetical protein PV07_08626 [Cladophialophora immunda]